MLCEYIILSRLLPFVIRPSTLGSQTPLFILLHIFTDTTFGCGILPLGAHSTADKGCLFMHRSRQYCHTGAWGVAAVEFFPTALFARQLPSCSFAVLPTSWMACRSSVKPPQKDRFELHDVKLLSCQRSNTEFWMSMLLLSHSARSLSSAIFHKSACFGE